MNDRWLKKDETGPYSGIEYGKQGDKVTLIEETNVIMSLVELKGTRFHVRTENLLTRPAEKEESPAPVEIEKEPVKIKWLPKAESKSVAKKNPIQKNLFE